MKISSPWNGRLRIAMPALSGLILLNTSVVFLLGGLTVISTHFSAQEGTPGYVVASSQIERYSMKMRLQLAFFYTIIPVLLLIESGSSNYSLWTDQLQPTYVAAASIVAPGLWALQLALWGLCLLTIDPNATEPGFCPAALKISIYHIATPQRFGSKRMAICAVPSLFLMYPPLFIFALMARKRAKQETCRHEIECGWYQRLLRAGTSSRSRSRSSTLTTGSVRSGKTSPLDSILESGSGERLNTTDGHLGMRKLDDR